MSIHIYIDQRERKNFNYFETIFNQPPIFDKRDNVTYEIKTLTVGDFLITHKFNDNEKILAVIERKTLKDYAATMKDDKRYQNKNKLIKLREETNCKVFYLVEGHLNPKYNTQYCGIEYSKILANIHTMEIVEDFHIVRQSNGENTAKWLKFIAEYYSGYVEKPEYLGNLEKEAISVIDQLKKCKLTPEQKDNECVVFCWKKIKNIGSKIAIYLSKSFTLKELITNQITEEMVLEAKEKLNFRISKNAINNIISPIDVETQIKILAEFPGVSKKGAESLLTMSNLSIIINPENKNEIADMKIGKNRFGEKKLEKIYQLVSCRFL